MLLMCCTQYASKFRKFSSGTELEKVSFHSNPKESQCQRVFKLLHNCTHLKPDILEYEVMWTLGRITTNNTQDVMESQLSYFKS